MGYNPDRRPWWQRKMSAALFREHAERLRHLPYSIPGLERAFATGAQVQARRRWFSGSLESF